MAAWDKKKTKQASTKFPRRKWAILSALFICFLFIVSPAYAHMADPPAATLSVNSIPIVKNIIFEKMYEKYLYSPADALFFCPLSKMFYNDDEKAAVETIILEAGGEGFEGMTAVGEVIRNRAKLFHKSFREICFMPKQFSCWNDPARAEQLLSEKHADYTLALVAWRESGQSTLTCGATDYHAASIHPYWADAYRVVAEIRNHIFYVRS